MDGDKGSHRDIYRSAPIHGYGHLHGHKDIDGHRYTHIHADPDGHLHWHFNTEEFHHHADPNSNADHFDADAAIKPEFDRDDHPRLGRDDPA